jgi:uncharacterized membrane protein YfcA
MTPILVLLFGVAPASAVGTDLWFAAITKLFGGVVHHRKGSVDWQVVRRLCLGSMPASIITLTWLHMAGGSQLKQGFIVSAIGGVLLLTAVSMLFKQRTHAIGRALREAAPEPFKRNQPALTVLAGAILGTIVTLTSVGAGALGTVMLVFLYPFRMYPARLVGTDVVHAIPLTLVAGTGHLLMGNVQFGLLANMLIGSIPGILLGSHLSHRIPEGVLRPVIALALFLVGGKLILA